MERVWKLCLALWVAVLLWVPGVAAREVEPDWGLLEDAQRLRAVVDDADVLIDGEEQIIIRRARQLSESLNLRLVVHTTRQLPAGMSIEAYTASRVHAWELGDVEGHEMLLVLSIGDRQSRIEVGRQWEELLTDREAGAILVDIQPTLRDRAYGRAVLRAISLIDDELHGRPTELQAQTQRQWLALGARWVILLFGAVMSLVSYRRYGTIYGRGGLRGRRRWFGGGSSGSGGGSGPSLGGGASSGW